MSKAFIIKDNAISVYVDGSNYNIKQSHQNFDKIKELLKTDFTKEQLEDMISTTKSILQYANGAIILDTDETLKYKGFVLEQTLLRKIVKMEEEGFDIDPMLKFVDNLLENPSSTAIKELYLFLESGELPITQDGHFLAYKKVRDNYRDVHSGTIDNSVGQIIEMRRGEVDDIRHNTCSHGLHFCSLGYLGHFGGERIVVLKINPKDVVSIPSDYKNTKGRTCKYEVIGEIPLEKMSPEDAFASSVDTYWSWEDSWKDDEEEENSWELQENNPVYNDMEGLPTCLYRGKELKEGYTVQFYYGNPIFRNAYGQVVSEEDACVEE